MLQVPTHRSRHAAAVAQTRQKSQKGQKKCEHVHLSFAMGVHAFDSSKHGQHRGTYSHCTWMRQVSTTFLLGFP